MADNNNTTQTISNEPSALFEPFSWHSDKCFSPSKEIAEIALDIAGGIKTVLGLIESCDTDREFGERPILSEFHRGRLMRLAICSASLLADRSSLMIQRENARSAEAAK